MKKIPFMLIVGEKEAAEHTVSVRAHGMQDMGVMPVEAFARQVNEEVRAMKNPKM